ncbi:MAG: ABC transporter ATP-binding protein [Clostridium sp.]|nr:ABC transporter ATP-binding protein [Clostridium sp.]
MSNILEVKDLYKTLGKREIIKGISFSIKPGEIFGFLGPNGAGKTTTIKMLVGIIAPTKGSIKIMGHDIQSEKVEALKNVGAIVETPELYSYLTGKQNLEQLARISKNITKEDIDKAAEDVGLKDRINDKVKKYSLGMKQRLGFAESLLGNPKFLILDEPTNGLDPNGIIEFRTMLKELAKEKKVSIFISSHILSEIQELCDTVAFIDNGKIQSIEEMNNLKDMAANAEDSNFENIIINTNEKEKCMDVLSTLEIVKDIKKEDEKLVLNIKSGSTSKIVFALSEQNIPIEEIYKKQIKLEDRYLELVKGGNK